MLDYSTFDYFWQIIFITLIVCFGGLSILLWSKKKFTLTKRVGLSILLAGAALGIIESAYIEPNILRTRREEIQTGKLNEKIKIVLLSDFHLRFGKNAGFVKKVAARIQAEKPDMIVITGDFLYYFNDERAKKDLPALAALPKIAPTFAVPGNHEYGISNRTLSILYPDLHQLIEEELKKDGIAVLKDEKVKIKINDAELWLVGFDERWRPKIINKNLVTSIKDDLLKIGLSHNPDAAFDEQNKNLDMVFSGHTHGGQIRLMFLGITGDAETDLPQKYYGRFLANHRPRILNTVGLGESGPPLRFLNPPEIVVLNIK